MKKFYVVALLGLLFENINAQINTGALPATLTQNFDGLGINSQGWTDNTSPLGGWYKLPSGTLNADPGTGTSAAVYNYGVYNVAERALGGLSSSGTTCYIGMRIKNNSGSTVNSVTITYTGEQWRQNVAAQTLAFSYQVGASVTGVNTGSWTSVTSLDFTSPNIGTAGALVGNSAANRKTITASFAVTIANNQEIMIRWVKSGSNGHGLAVDDLTVYLGSVTTLAPYTTQLSGNISKGATNEPIAGFTITNSESSDFTGVTVTGVGISTDVTNIRIYSDNNGNGLIDGADASVSNIITNLAGSMVFTISAETGFTGTRSYLIVGDIASSTSGANVQVSIASAAYTTTAMLKIGSMANVTRTFATPSVTIASIGPVAGSIYAGIDNNIIYNFSLAVTVSNAYVTSVNLPISFTDILDFKSSGFKLWYRASINTLGGATQLLPSVDPSGGNLTFTLSSSQLIATGVTGYFWVTADIASNATVNNSVTGGSLPVANVLFSTAVNSSGTPSAAGAQTIIAQIYAAFDNFNRTDNTTVGIPSSGGSVAWTETESTASGPANASVFSNQLRLSTSYVLPAGIGTSTTGRDMISFDMSSRYSTQFNTSSGPLYWYFNVKQSRSTPGGFDGTTYGAAFVLGSTQSNFTSASANGYAVIIGNTSTPDPVKLIYFTGGLVGNYPALGANDIVVSAETGTTNYYSVIVTYNPCTNGWSLQVRNDGSSAFADPTAGTYINPAITGTNSTHVSSDLKYLGALWNHQAPASGSDDAYFDNFYIPSSAAIGSTYTWIGGTPSFLTDYQVATNWTPSRTCPRVTDRLQFNASSPATSTLTNVPTQTIGQFAVSNNVTVILKDVAADVSSSTLTIGGLSGTDLQVDAGSSLIFDVASSDNVNDAMIISLATGATGLINGTVIFQNTNPGTTARSHRLLAASANSISVYNGGIIRASDLLGNAFGTTGTTNVVNFYYGAAYEFYDGAHPFGFNQPSSKVVFNNGSIYRHKYSGTDPSLFGRTYSNFEFDVTSGTVEMEFGSNVAGATFVVDTLKVLTGTLFLSGSTNVQPVNTVIKGDLLMSNGAAFNYSPVAGAASTLTFNSSTKQQKINNAGTLTFGSNSTVQLNSTYATEPQLLLQSNVSIGGTLNITLGTIDAVTYTLDGAAGNLTMTGGKLKLSKNNTTLPELGGTYSLTGGTVEFSGDGTTGTTGAQTIKAVNYYNLTSSSIGNRVLVNTGIIGVANTFSPGTNAYTITNSTVDFNGAVANQTITDAPFTFYNVGFKNGGTKTLGASISVQKELTIDNNTTTLALSTSNLTLVSTNSLTANVAQVPATAAITYGTGKFIIERNVAALRSWRLLTTPVISSQTMRAAWMEGAAPSTTLPLPFNEDLVPSYGTHISGPSPATNGFDETPLNNYSVKYYNGSAWVGTGIQPGVTLLTSKPGWMLFIRGDRNYPISTTTVGTAAQTTTLRSSGSINIGTMPAINPSGFTIVGNPYPSAINFSSVTKSGGGDIFYLWDPRITSGTTSTTVGGWITCTRKPGGGVTEYAMVPKPVTASIDSLTGRIESGAAIAVNSLNITTLNFKETDKASGSNLVFRPHHPSDPVSSLRTNLYVKNGDGSLALFDGVMHFFDQNFNNNVDGADALKLKNFSENLSIATHDSLLAIEKRRMPAIADTIFYHIKQLKLRNYTLEFGADNLVKHTLAGYIVDNYLKVKTPLNMQGITRYDFTVSTDSGSYDVYRFNLVFKHLFRFAEINTSKLSSNIKVTWQAEETLNIQQFEVQHSNDGINFTSVSGTTLPINANFKTGYALSDDSPFKGINYYRVKANGKNGEIFYSNIAIVQNNRENATMYISPNPATGNMIFLQMNKVPTGNYIARLMNTAGQIIVEKKILHNNLSETISILYPNYITAGTYQLEVTAPGNKKSIIPVLIENK